MVLWVTALTPIFMTGHWIVTASLRLPVHALGEAQVQSRALKVRSFYVWLSHSSSFPSDSLQLSDLESLYHDFRSIYHRHVQTARFGVTLRRDPYFENRKLRLVAVRYLLDKHRNLPSQTRSELIQALIKGDFYRAENLLSKTDGKKRADSSSAGWGSLFSAGPGDFLNRDMRMLASSISDSQFLLDMKGITDPETRSTIQEIEGLAHAQLASAIDATVNAMTRNVLAMQQEYCTRSIQHEMESEERK